MSEREHNLKSMGAMEFIGTAILVGTIQCVSTMNAEYRSQVEFAILIGLIYMGFEISGAHYNPAVTLTHLLRRRCSIEKAFTFISMQLAGGVVGAFAARSISHKGAVLAVGAGYTWKQAAYTELIFTTILCFAVLTIALRRNAALHPVFGVAIASVIYGGTITASPVSGAAFNPAVAIALSFGNGFTNFEYAWFLSIAHMSAAVTASGLFYIVASDEYDAVKWPWIRRKQLEELAPLLPTV